MKLSIITVNYNNGAGLKKTLESIHIQTCRPDQCIVIDGGSTDSSKEVIKQYSSMLSYWISEPDAGVYEAMNKGIKVATGEYVLFINSGDVLADANVLQQVNKSFPGKDLVYGNLLLDYGTGPHQLKKYPSSLPFGYFFYKDESLPHPSTFIKKSLFDKVGLYNENLRIVSDWEFWLKAIFLHNASYQYIPLAVSVFDMGGMSSNQANSARIALEKKEVYTTSFSHLLQEYKGIYVLRQQSKVGKLLQVLKKRVRHM
jgi:glycosyltransferase involved in cell wall biosynthesis